MGSSHSQSLNNSSTVKRAAAQATYFHLNQNGGAEPPLSVPPDDSAINRLSYIATHYILTMDFKSLRRMYRQDYCNKLVFITAEIFNKYFTNLEVQDIASSIQTESELLPKNHVLFAHKSDFKEIMNSDTGKMSLCIQIATYYIKIAHLFAAVVMTINPRFEYKYGKKEGVVGLDERSSIPEGAEIKVRKSSFCDSRIEALQTNMNSLQADRKKAAKNPCFVEAGRKKDKKVKDQPPTLRDEPGILELEQLYYDDGFDYKTGKFTTMSDSAKARYYSDLTQFYMVFTGNPVVPPEITKFSDIELHPRSKPCAAVVGGALPNEEVQLPAPVAGPSQEVQLPAPVAGPSQEGVPLAPAAGPSELEFLFTEYANNLKKMVDTTTESQQKLLGIINTIFVSVSHADSDKKFIRISPTLTDKKLQELIDESRSTIVELYLNCERDSTKGIQLYEAIVESLLLKTSQEQLKNLDSLAEGLIQDYNA